MTIANNTSIARLPPASNQITKLTIITAKLACITRSAPKPLATAPSPSRPTMLAPPITPTRAAAAPEPIPSSSA